MSAGRVVITTAGNNAKVVGLAYIAAHAPDAGESEAGTGKTYPTSLSLPDLKRMYARRAKSIQTVEVEGASHSVYITHPREVAALIVAAAKGK